jgi:hypothetical protein
VLDRAQLVTTSPVHIAFLIAAKPTRYTVTRAIATSLALLASTPVVAQADEWDLCAKTSLSQVVAALHRNDVATLSRPEMIHGTCTSEGILKSGKPIGMRIIFAPDGEIGTSVYTPLSNADPMTNPTPHQFPVGRQ